MPGETRFSTQSHLPMAKETAVTLSNDTTFLWKCVYACLVGHGYCGSVTADTAACSALYNMLWQHTAVIMVGTPACALYMHYSAVAKVALIRFKSSSM